MTNTGGLVVSRSTLRIPIALCAVGALGLVIGLIAAPTRTWMNLLVDGFYVMSIGVSAIFFFATQRLSSARWSKSIRRIPEAFMQVMPAAVVLMVVLAFGFRSLYPWMDQSSLHEEGLSFTPGREIYLNTVFVYVRMAVILAVWTFFALRIRKISVAGDTDPAAGMRAHRQLNRYAGVFAPVFALTIAMAAYDWIISLDPKWFSTMFSVYVFAGCFVQGIAGIGLTTVLLKKRGAFGTAGSQVTMEPVHTLGTMLLAFCTFWAYIWVCQYLLIWYGNIPEEVTYYLRRSSAPWLPLFLISFVINWIIPFFVLLPRANKRNYRIMAGICILVLFGRWLDLYIMVMPQQWDSPKVGPIEVAMAAGAVGVIWLLVVRALSRAPLVPPHDPSLAARRAQEGGHS